MVDRVFQQAITLVETNMKNSTIDMEVRFMMRYKRSSILVSHYGLNLYPVSLIIANRCGGVRIETFGFRL